ncbi:hypothetical protein BN14_00805 [Rhizoctonia solani AG-1 IB]|uniref:Uncharacterized protein n=1 Tax=Thanatephorus cucumeris (strain AG1-IB / isolate 7/3/14) TaxID=1108050 RepID=M5BJF3_THACB|nr:hypothetical protein BN14_00805 [Rhizoctonia solani AG-1 IB]
MIEKTSMINLIQAFSVSVKHYLRGEPGIYYQDLYPLIAFLPQYAVQEGPAASTEKLPLWSDDSNAGGHHLPRDPNSTEGGFKRKKNKTFDPEKALPDVTPDHVHLAPARNPPPTTFFDYFPILMPFKTIYKLVKRIFVRREDDESIDGERSAWTGKKKHRPVVESIVPLEIAYVYLSFDMQSTVANRKCMQPPPQFLLQFLVAKWTDAGRRRHVVQQQPPLAPRCVRPAPPHCYHAQ